MVDKFESAEKGFATVQARAALHGIALHQIESDYGRTMFVATIWALTRAFESLGDVDAWLQGVEAGQKAGGAA